MLASSTAFVAKDKDTSCHTPRGAHLPYSGLEHAAGWTTRAGPTVIFPAAERHRPLTSTKLCRLVPGHKGLNNFPSVVSESGVEPVTFWWQPTRCASRPMRSVWLSVLVHYITGTLHRNYLKSPMVKNC